MVLLDDLGVDEGDEEDSGEEEEAKTDAEADGSDVPRRLVVEAEIRGALVDDREGADGAGDQEEEGRGVDSHGDGVLAHMHRHLDEHKDDGSEAARDEGGGTQAGKDGTETRAASPAPLDLARADGSDTDTRDGGDERVGGRDVGGVAGAPHDPDGGTGGRASEGQELDAGVLAEGVAGDDAVLDGGGGSGADGEGTRHLEDDTEDHGLSVADGPRRDTGGPGIGNIV